jgi:hypothetical protein
LELLLMPTAEVAARAQEELKLSSVWVSALSAAQLGVRTAF